MTTTIKVSVNGNYKIPVKRGNDDAVFVSGRGHDGPNEQTFYPTHGDGATFVIGPETPDNGEAEAPADDAEG